MASKFELQNPLFTSVTRTLRDIQLDISVANHTPLVIGLVNGYFEYNAEGASPGVITKYEFKLPSIAAFQQLYPDVESLEAGCRFTVANRFRSADYPDLDVEVLFDEADGYVTTEYFPEVAGPNRTVIIEPETQVEFAITFRKDDAGVLKGFACAYPPLTIPALTE